MMSPRTVVWLSVAAGLVAALIAGMRSVPGTAVVEAMPARRAAPPPPPAAAPVPPVPADDALHAPRGRALGGSKANPFGAMNWKPLPPPVAAAPAPPPPEPSAPPPPPTAPPLPFVFVGMAERGAERPQAYLAKGSTLLVVSVGDLIDGGRYRVDALSSTAVNLTYLPLNKPQTLSIP